jgi:hypothetical protein
MDSFCTYISFCLLARTPTVNADIKPTLKLPQTEYFGTRLLSCSVATESVSDQLCLTRSHVLTPISRLGEGSSRIIVRTDEWFLCQDKRGMNGWSVTLSRSSDFLFSFTLKSLWMSPDVQSSGCRTFLTLGQRAGLECEWSPKSRGDMLLVTRNSQYMDIRGDEVVYKLILTVSRLLFRESKLFEELVISLEQLHKLRNCVPLFVYYVSLLPAM